jgi:mycothiol system anti-sigma-R factor
MECIESLALMAAYVDGELDAATCARMEAHLAQCEACVQAYARQRALGGVVRGHAQVYTAPAHLRQRILDALPRPAPPPRAAPRWPWAWINLGLGGAVGAVFAVALTLSAIPPAAPLEQELVDSHFRSLLAEHLTDVVSSDQHTVKPWFTGKLDFSPPVRDLAAQGYPLIGGRVDYIGGRVVAALAYRHGKHVLNLYVWPDRHEGKPGGTPAPRQGFQLASWSDAGMRYWAVSDMNATELEHFRAALAAQ